MVVGVRRQLHGDVQDGTCIFGLAGPHVGSAGDRGDVGQLDLNRSEHVETRTLAGDHQRLLHLAPTKQDVHAQGSGDDLVESIRGDTVRHLHPSFRRVEPARDVFAPAPQERAHGVGFGGIAERHQHSSQGLDLIAGDELRTESEHGAGRFGVLPGLEVVNDRPMVITLGLEPSGSPQVEPGELVGNACPCFGSEQIPQEMVVAEPLTGAIEPDDELVLSGGLAQPLAAMG